MRQALLFFLISLLVIPPVGALRAQQKPQAALGRVATLGDISEAQKKIIANRLESRLSQSYNLVSQEQYRKAEEAAFAELDLAKCTEEECIRKIQEVLQVERLLLLQIIREEEVTQLSLNLVRTDSKQIAEDICERCNIIQLYQRIDKLAEQLISDDIRAGAREMIAEQPVAEPPPAAEPEAEEEEEGGFPWWGWALIGVGVAGAAASSSGGGGGGGGSSGSVGFSY